MKTKFLQKIQEIEEIINQCEVCYLAMADNDNTPYVLPFNFGYESNTIYLHSAPVGKKMNILKTNNKVCVAFSTDHEIYGQHKDVACSYSMKSRSVVAFGKVVFIEDLEEKKRVLNLIMKKYTGRDDFTYSTPAITNVCVYKVMIEQITGKERGYSY